MDSLSVNLGEVNLYGSSRLGSYSSGLSVDGAPGDVQDIQHFNYLRGLRQYELTNHLGNVVTTISDKNLGVPSDDSSLNVYFEPDIVAANDYYPFGMLSRVALAYNDHFYRYGFNGKENDWEAKGWQNQLDYGARIYDPRVGRFLSIDPLAGKIPGISPYVAMENNTIINIDPDGAFAVKRHYAITYGIMLRLGKAVDVADRVAHFASTYVDHPTQKVLDKYNKGERYEYRSEYIKNGTYNKTAHSQDDDPEHEKWHSMMTDQEKKSGMSHDEAMQRGMAFGWGLILSSVKSGSETDLGQGLHALQDAYAHKGASHSEHLGINMSSAGMLLNDMYGNPTAAERITLSAIVVTDLMKGNTESLAWAIKQNSTFDFTGMNADRIQATKDLFKKNGYTLQESSTQRGLIYSAVANKKE